MSLDSRITALISIGASVGANCQACLQYHVAKAKENGVSEQEIEEAIAMGENGEKRSGIQDGSIYCNLTGCDFFYYAANRQWRM